MLTIATWFRCEGTRAASWFLALFVVVTGLAGCGTIQFENGRKFNPAVLEQSLKTGVSTQADVRRALGEPYGQGRALMPFHESDRTVWTYYYERGSVDVGASAMRGERLYLFVFLAGDRFDGYMWFESKLN